MLICGVDEAGRGSLVSALVICGIVIEEKDIIKLKNIGVRDSKLLSPRQREEMYEKIKKVVKRYAVNKISAKEIDARFSVGTNLNKLEIINMADIINKLKPDKAYIDAVSPNARRFKEELKPLIETKTKLYCEHKADVKYPVVSAASIIAKVDRDADVRKIEKEYNISLGVGYPHAKEAIDFVKQAIKNGKVPDFVRKSWMTFQTLKQEKEQKKLGEF